MEKDEALTWRGPYLEACMYMTGQHLATDAEYIILDMPPGTGDIHRAVLDLCPQARFLLVATAGELALTDLQRAFQGLASRKNHVLGLVENMAYKKVSGTHVHLWGEPEDVPALAERYEIPFFGTLPMAKQEVRLPIVKDDLLPQVLEALEQPPKEPPPPRVIQRETLHFTVDLEEPITKVVEE